MLTASASANTSSKRAAVFAGRSQVTLARAEMLRTGIAGLRLEHRGQPIGDLTVSLGVAAFPRHGVTGEVLLRAADEALYSAKEGGRNRVELAQVGE